MNLPFFYSFFNPLSLKLAPMGKRGGARVIYFNRLDQGVIVLLTIYVKAKFDNIPAHILKVLKEVAEHE